MFYFTGLLHGLNKLHVWCRQDSCLIVISTIYTFLLFSLLLCAGHILGIQQHTETVNSLSSHRAYTLMVHLGCIILSLMEKTQHFQYFSGPSGGNMATSSPFNSKFKIARKGSNWPDLDQSSVVTGAGGRVIMFIYLFLFLFFLIRIIFYFIYIVVGFVIHWHESAMDIHVFPIPIHPPTSPSTWSLWVFPVHQAWALVSCIQPGLVICFTLDNIHVLMLFSWNIPPSPSPIESKSLFYTSVSLFLFCI